MGRVFSNQRIMGLAAACLFLSSLPVGGAQQAAYVEELKALAELHEQGMITDEEFAAKKAQLLGLDPKETTSETAEDPTLSQEQAPDAGQPMKIKLPEGTEIYLVFAEALSSGSNTEGDRFHLRVDDDVKVDGAVVIPRDAIAVGTVKVAKKRRRMGRAGQLSITLDYVKAGDERVRLRSSKTKEGEGRVGSTVALTVLFGPLGLLKRGKDIEVQEGSPITAFVDQDVELIVPVEQDVEVTVPVEQDVELTVPVDGEDEGGAEP